MLGMNGSSRDGDRRDTGVTVERDTREEAAPDVEVRTDGLPR